MLDGSCFLLVYLYRVIIDSGKFTHVITSAIKNNIAQRQYAQAAVFASTALFRDLVVKTGGSFPPDDIVHE